MYRIVIALKYLKSVLAISSHYPIHFHLTIQFTLTKIANALFHLLISHLVLCQDFGQLKYKNFQFLV